MEAVVVFLFISLLAFSHSQDLFLDNDSNNWDTSLWNLGDSLSNLQLIFNGFWEQGGLTDPVDEIKCFDQITAQQTLDALSQILSELAADKYQQAIRTGEAYVNNLPESVKTCIKTNSETKQMEQAYGLADITATAFESKLLKYITLHHSAFKTQINAINNDDQKGNFKNVGKGCGQLVMNVLK